MKTKLVSIGNSKGIRIPMAILKQCNIENEVHLEVEKEKIVIKPVKTNPREGWNDAFRLMHEKKDDALLIDETMDIAMENWEWK
ncbi:MAG: AbrB/MazE/SpoVT family DNA-binding domain-containing protein [Candidatus Brocadiales bacterium]|nr:AbrB/MazE/SpoVT family DNA-binding domain-containing protein [Candidatus Brocadiales bacterium]